MAFLPQNFDDGKTIDMPAAAAAYTKGQALVYASGNVSTASAGGNVEIPFVSMEAKTIATAGDPLKCITTHGVRFLADTDAAPAQTDCNTEADLAAATTVDPNASTDDIFYIEKVVMPLADKKVIGYFMHANPNA